MTDPPDCSDIDPDDTFSLCELYRAHGLIHPNDDGWRIQCDQLAALEQIDGGLSPAGARGAAAAAGD
jgi:hypothetical protein